MRNANKLLLGAVISLLALLWAARVSAGMPGMFGQWPGFEAAEKGFPGWSEYDQTRGTDKLSVTRELEQERGHGSYQGFEGAQQGQYPGGRPHSQ